MRGNGKRGVKRRWEKTGEKRRRHEIVKQNAKYRTEGWRGAETGETDREIQE